MIPWLKRHEIQVLLRAEHSRADVARRTGVTVYTVRRVEKEAAVATADDAEARKARGIGRPSIAAPFTEKVRAWLTERTRSCRRRSFCAELGRLATRVTRRRSTHWSRGCDRRAQRRSCGSRGLPRLSSAGHHPHAPMRFGIGVIRAECPARPDE
jgi:hypothetical protein